MLYQWIRVLKDKSGTITDLSLDNQENETVINLDLAANVDSLYIGQYFPFNNFFNWVDNPNDIAGILDIEYWNGKEFIPVVDVLDATYSNGITLAKSGVTQFSPNRDDSWSSISNTADESVLPSELRAKEIYDMYWLKISSTTGLNALTTLNRISYAFTNEQILRILDKKIDRFLQAFGIPDWTTYILNGSIELLIELKNRGLVVTEGQVLRFTDISQIAGYKVLELIYRNLGDDYRQKRIDVAAEKDALISNSRLITDLNFNAVVDPQEQGVKRGWLKR